MDGRLNKIEEKLEVVVEKIHAIDKTMERNTASLEEHVKRTNLLEEKLTPVEDHVKAVNAVLKFIGALSILAGLFLTIRQLFQ